MREGQTPPPATNVEDIAPPAKVETVDCCVVGGGPGGAVLALLLARKGVRVTLLEAHDDFDRDFRGDTLHPSSLELMDELGLAERLLRLRHSKIHRFTLMTPDGPVTVADFRRLRTRFPYIMMLPQARFLEFLTEEAKRYPTFRLRMGARVDELIEEDGEVRGVRFESDAGPEEVRATLTVGADGRGSRLRHLSGLDEGMMKTSPPMDVLWFRVPREPEDPEGAVARFGRGHAVVMLDRVDEWQVAYLIIKGSFREVRAAGIAALRESLAEVVTDYAARFECLKEWKQVAVLSVESSRVRRWHRPGLLLIGDAAHVMSPVGGVGINYAIQDAVVAANVVARPLRKGLLRAEDLAEVQLQREWPTRVIQSVQTAIQKTVVANALKSDRPLGVPPLARLLLRVPVLRDIPARVIAFGPRRVRVED